MCNNPCVEFIHHVKRSRQRSRRFSALFTGFLFSLICLIIFTQRPIITWVILVIALSFILMLFIMYLEPKNVFLSRKLLKRLNNFPEETLELYGIYKPWDYY